MIDRVESFFDLPAIQEEFAAIKAGLGESQSSLVGLYNVIKGFKDTSISTLAANTDQLSTAINGSVQSVTKAKTGYDELTQKITAQVKAVNESITSINENSEAYDQLIKQAVKNKIANDDLAASANALKKAYQGGQTSLDQYQESLASIKEAQVSLKTSNADVTRALNNMEKQAQSSSGSLDQLRAKLGELNMAYDKLSETERGSTQGQGLLKTIQTTDQALKQLEGSTGRFRMNVGNYEGAFATLREELVNVNRELAEMAAKGKGVQNMNPVGFRTTSQRPPEGLLTQTGSGPTNLAGGIGFDPARYKELSSQAAALNIILEQQEKGFSSVTMATRAAERALQTMASVGLEGSEGFDKLRESTIEAAQAQKEFLRQEKLLESEAPVLGAITLAAKGLAGAYAVGAGSVALFAEGNEKVEKELNKLVAIMTILQGLNEAYELINKSGAGAQAIKMALTRATNSLIGEQVVKTKAAAVADTELAAAETEVAATTEAQAAATTELAVATDGVVVAEEAATAATITLGRAVVMTGIGAAIAVVAVAIGYLISKIPDWIQGNKLTIKEQENLADAMKKANDIMIQQADMITDLDSTDRRYYENQLALSSAAGENAYKQFAIKKNIAAEEKRLAKEQMDLLGADNAAQSQRAATIQNLREKQQAALKIQQDMILAHRNLSPLRTDVGKAEAKEQEEVAAKNVEFYQKQIDIQQGVYDAAKKAREEYYAAIQKDGQLEYEQEKFTADEQRKLALETVNLQVEAVKDRNARILELETSSRAQQRAALLSDRNAALRQAQAEYENVKNDPATTPNALLIAQKELDSKRLKANDEYHDARADRDRKFYEQDRDANLDALKTELQDRIAADQDIEQGKNQNNPDPLQPQKKADLATRLNALSDEYAARRDIITAERQKELDAERIDGTESLALAEDKQAKIKDINAKYTSQIIELNKDAQKTYLELEAEARDRSIKEWEMYYSRRKEQIDENLDQHLVALNQSHEGNKNYNRDRTRLEDQGAVNSASNTVDQAKTERDSTADNTQARIDADEKLTKSAEALSEAKHKQNEDQQEQTKKQVEEDLQNLQTVGNAGIEIEEIGYNRQVIDLQNLEKREARAFEVQTKQIQDSSASQEQKALRMKILDDQQAAQTEKNARKQRQLDIEKAKYDKAKAIMDIILNTAVAVTKALDDPFLEAAIIIAGAAELATAIATPLPKYKQGAGVAGRPAHKGGLGVVGDAFIPELIAEPGKAPFWSPAIPTVLDMAPGARIYPPEEINRMISSGMFVNQFGIIQQKETNRDMIEIKQAIVWQTGRIERALAKNKPKVINNIKLDAKFGNHIHKSVFQ